VVYTDRKTARWIITAWKSNRTAQRHRALFDILDPEPDAARRALAAQATPA